MIGRFRGSNPSKTTSEGCQRPKLFARQINRRTGCLKGVFLKANPVWRGG
ncbi:MAG: hypothetical protein ACTS6H_03095 [Candidatus Hodgkinia cicadicola]